MKRKRGKRPSPSDLRAAALDGAASLWDDALKNPEVGPFLVEMLQRKRRQLRRPDLTPRELLEVICSDEPEAFRDLELMLYEPQKFDAKHALR